jgi:ATP-dependent Zn protease
MCEQKIEEIARWCEEEAAALLSKHKPLVELLAKRLLEKYTLQKDEILEVYREYTESLADNH